MESSDYRDAKLTYRLYVSHVRQAAMTLKAHIHDSVFFALADPVVGLAGINLQTKWVHLNATFGQLDAAFVEEVYRQLDCDSP
jgi:hypothetical protein